MANITISFALPHFQEQIPMEKSSHRIQFLNCPIDQVTMDQVINQCITWCREPRQSQIIVTVNATTLVMMQTNSKLHEACTNADLVVADGVPVVWVSRLFGTPLPERVAGVDLLSRLLEESSKHQLRVYFLGAKRNVLAKLVALCREKYPGAQVVGYQDGYFSEAEYSAVIETIHNSHTDLLFIGMPTPFKEVWSYQYKNNFNVPIILGVGGSFDVLAGFIRRAPQWVQKIGMEWFWRVMMEPRKLLKRHLVVNTLFIKSVLREWWIQSVNGLKK
jgi:N-acetylglucosaminyldiphosphoundecaprenol N-acetyl-beta-D-mannosaminyltransferase